MGFSELTAADGDFGSLNMAGSTGWYRVFQRAAGASLE